MCNDNELAYEWQNDDDYPHRSDVDTIERTIAFSRYGEEISVADTRFAVAPSVVLETIQNFLRYAMQHLTPPPDGYAVCCWCNEYTPNTSAKCQCCGGIYTPF